MFTSQVNLSLFYAENGVRVTCACLNRVVVSKLDNDTGRLTFCGVRIAYYPEDQVIFRDGLTRSCSADDAFTHNATPALRHGEWHPAHMLMTAVSVARVG